MVDKRILKENYSDGSVRYYPQKRTHWLLRWLPGVGDWSMMVHAPEGYVDNRITWDAAGDGYFSDAKDAKEWLEYVPPEKPKRQGNTIIYRGEEL